MSGVLRSFRDVVELSGDGTATYRGLTNRHGELVDYGCTEVGLDCVPFHLEGYDGPAGVLVDISYQYRGDAREYDLRFL